MSGNATSQVVSLNQAQPSYGPLAIIGAGTGLGQCVVAQIEPILILPSEGGHADFAPQNEPQIALWAFLHKRHGHVSYERVLSGSGLVAIYEFLCEQGHPANSEVDKLLDDPSRPQIISQQASLHDPTCMAALDEFICIYGAEAGNLILRTLPHAGLFIAGGIAAKILPQLQSEKFMTSVTSKGRLSEVCSKFPVYVITDPQAALYGAAYLAMQDI